MATRLRGCDEAIAAGRLRKAEQFLEGAANLRDVADDEAEFGDALVTLCVHAGIAASDVLCCKALGHFVQGDDHMRAVAELAKVTPGGKQLGKDLQVLLQMKSAAAYGAPPMTAGGPRASSKRPAPARGDYRRGITSARPPSPSPTAGGVVTRAAAPCDGGRVPPRGRRARRPARARPRAASVLTRRRP